MRSALADVEGVDQLQVSLPDKAVVTGSATPDALIGAVKDAGYDAEVRQ